MANNGYTAATATSIPIKLLDDPLLLRDAETLKYCGEKIGKVALGLAFAFDLYLEKKMKLIKSNFFSVVCILISIFMFAFFTFSLFFIDEDKYMILFATFFLGILFSMISTSKIEYDEKQIFIEMFLWKKIIIISQIKSITYSGIPNVCTFECSSGKTYVPLFYPKKKLREMLELIKKNNPAIIVIKEIG